MNLDDLPQDLLLARGQYATIRSAHEDAKARISILCGDLGATSAKILHAVQPRNDEPIEAKAVADLVAVCRKAIVSIEECAKQIEALAVQRAALKPQAWPKR